MSPRFAFNNMSAFNGNPIAPLMVGSIRRHMPDSRIIQLSDSFGEQTPGVDRLVKYDFKYDEKTYPQVWFQLMYSVYSSEGIGAGGIVCCDADMIFMGDISPLLDDEYDIAICRRFDDNTGILYRIFHPYNIGFMIIKNPDIVACCSNIISLSKYNNTFSSLGQHIIGLVVNSGEFKVKFLDGAIYNRTPKNIDDYDENVKVWHFKGDRKDWRVDWTKRHHV